MSKVLNASTIPRLKIASAEPELFTFSVRGRHFTFDVNSLQLVAGDEEVHGWPYKSVFPGPSRVCPMFLCLEVCHACNMKCSYCFAQAYYPGIDMMTLETARKAIRYFFPRKEFLTKDPRASIGFFGGEPLLNWKLMREIVPFFEGLCSPRQPSFHVTTNGTLVTAEIAAFLKQHNFSLIVSLDGPKEVHNTCRTYRNGDGTFDNVIDELKLLREAGLSSRITLRATYTSKTAFSLVERAEFLNKLCYDGLASWVSIEPAFLTESRCIRPEDAKQGIDDAIVSELDEEYLKVADWYIAEVNAGRRPVFHNITKFIERILWALPNASECGAGTGYFSANAKGELFACHREQSSGIGNLEEEGIDVSLQAKWLDNRLYLREKCMKCSIRFVCGGGCRERSIGECNDIRVPVDVECKLKEVFFRAAVWIMSELDPEELKKVVPLPAEFKHPKERRNHERKK